MTFTIEPATRIPSTLLIPGIDGSCDAHWQRWWTRVEEGAAIVEQTNWSAPDPREWTSRIARAVRERPGAVLVAHSLGCHAVARLLHDMPDLPVAGALLVAPPDVARSRRLAAFANTPRNALPVPSLLVASRDDPWMAFDDARALACDWASAFVDYGASGHINVASGFGPWPSGLALRNALRKDGSRAADRAAFVRCQYEANQS